MASYIGTYYGRDVKLPPGTYRVEKCNSCRSLFQAEVGDDELFAWLYDDILEFVANPGAELPDDRFDVHNLLTSRDGHEITSASVYLNKTKMITLDVGMGWGSWASIAKSLGHKSYKVGSSAKQRARAERFGIEVLADIDGVRADFINAEQLFEHLADPRETMTMLSHALVPGGILKIAVPAPHRVERALGDHRIKFPDIMPIQPLEHLTCFNRKALESMSNLTPFRLSYRQRYAFLSRGKIGGIRGLVRPLYTYGSRTTLVVWLRKLPAPSA